MTGPVPKPLDERFWSKVTPEPNTGCWLWTASVNASGYGQVGVGGRYGSTEVAHRVAWTLAKGPVPDGVCVLHRCDNRVCVNPDHLFLGTKADNTHDMLRKGREAGGERHWTRTPGGRERVRNGTTKLAEPQVREIRDRLAQGDPQRAIARDFGVSQTAVSDIRRRKRWARVP